MYCSNCGKQVSDGANFCGECGTRIESNVASQVVQYQPPQEVPQSISQEVQSADSLSEYQHKKVTNDSVVIHTINNFIHDFWPKIFRDYDEGRDIVRWQGLYIDFFGPILFKRDETFPSVLSGDDAIDFIVPCFFDSQPLQSKQANGSKLKFNGKYSEGFLLFTAEEIINIYMRDEEQGVIAVGRSEISDIVEFNKVNFKFGKLSMTSAGLGYEIMFKDRKELFRVALITDGGPFESIFENKLKGRFIPLFKGMHCKKWVAREDAENPKDETGELRHYPYVE